MLRSYYNRYKIFSSYNGSFIYVYDEDIGHVIEWMKVEFLNVMGIEKTVPWYGHLLEWHVNRFPARPAP